MSEIMDTDAKKLSRRPQLIGGILAGFLLLGLVWLGYWLIDLRFTQSTDDAYTAGNIVRISPQVSGSVSAILVDNTNSVKAGQVLARLDTRDAELAFDYAAAALAGTVREMGSLMAESARLESLVDREKLQLEKVRGDLKRRKERNTAQSISAEELHHAYVAVDLAEKTLQVAQSELLRNRILLQDNVPEEHPLVRQRAHDLRQAWLDLQRCTIKSPVDGVIARRTVQPGMHVTPETPLMAVVPLHEIWVDANFKEVQLADMRIGQPATIKADIYGSSVRYEGVLAGFSPGTGSSFSLLPPENATGNWIKVVQRVPVKIILKPDSLNNAPLMIGLSCSVDVDVSNTDGPLLSTPEDAGIPALSTDVLEYNLTVIDQKISAIIKENSALNPE
jgi:membrane fusion protein (multidrug efflux system)